MAYTRTKKLTDSTYAPTSPTSEAQARLVIDDAIDELNLAYGSGNGADYIGEIHGGSVQDRLDYIEGELAGISQGAVADGAITTVKLADDAVTTDKILDDAVTSAKIADDTITDDNMAAAMKKGIAGGLAPFDDMKYVKIKTFTGATNAVTQIDLDVSDIDLDDYHEVIIRVDNILKPTAGAGSVGFRFDNNSGDDYHITGVRAGAGTVSGEEHDELCVGVNYTETYPASLILRMSKQCTVITYSCNLVGWDTTYSVFRNWYTQGLYHGSAALSTFNVIAGVANSIKSGVAFNVYGVLK